MSPGWKLLGARIQGLRGFEALVGDWRDTGEVSADLVEAIQELTGADFSHMLDQTADVRENLEANIELIQDLRKGLEEFIPGRTQEANVLSDLLRTGRLSAELTAQLREAGAPKELLREFAESRNALFQFQMNTMRWRDEFAYEEEEYRLQMAVEEAAFSLHNALDITTSNLDASLSANNEALEAAIEEAMAGLTTGVEDAAVAFDASLTALADTLSDAIYDLEAAIRDLIEALAAFQFGGGALPSLPGRVRPTSEWAPYPGSGPWGPGNETLGPSGQTGPVHPSLLPPTTPPVPNPYGGLGAIQPPDPPPAPPPPDPPPPPERPVNSPSPGGGGGGDVNVHVHVEGGSDEDVVYRMVQAIERNEGEIRDRIRGI